MYENITVRLEDATSKAENASGIIHDVANGAEGEFVTTESGQVPTIPEFLKQLDDKINTEADSYLVGAIQARDDAEGFRDESEQFLIQTGNLAQEVSDNKVITDQNVVTSTEQATIATDQAVIAQAAADQAIANTNITYMQSSPSQLDEYNYPDKTLYENGDGFITYYPEYAVFRKVRGEWEYLTPHLRNVLTFNGASQYAVAPRVAEIDLGTIFEIEVALKGLDPSLGTQGFVVESSVTGTKNYRLYYYHTGDTVRFDATNGSAVDAIPYQGDGIYGVRVDYSASTVEGFFDGVSQGVKALPTQIFERDSTLKLTIGAFDSDTPRLFCQGQLRDIKIWTGGDRNTGTLTRNYRMDEGGRGSNRSLVNYATELGEDLVVNGDFSDGLNGFVKGVITGTGWIAEDGMAVLDYEAGVSDGILNFYNPDPILVGKPFILSYDQPEWVGGDPRMAVYLDGRYTYPSNPTGIKTELIGHFMENRSVSWRQNSSTPYRYTLDNVSIRKAEGYGQYIGLTESSWAEEIV